jgi:hypothetical protein
MGSLLPHCIFETEKIKWTLFLPSSLVFVILQTLTGCHLLGVLGKRQMIERKYGLDGLFANHKSSVPIRQCQDALWCLGMRW